MGMHKIRQSRRARLSAPIIIAATLTVSPMPPAFAADGDRQKLGQDICNILPSKGSPVWDSGAGCRWAALPDRLLVQGEVVELFIRQSADERVSNAIGVGHKRYIDQMKGSYLFTRVTELNLCSQSAPAGRKIVIYHAEFVEVFGYAECNGKTVSLKVYLDKNGGSSPNAVFDDLFLRISPLLVPGS
jgi:hypothetical protein